MAMLENGAFLVSLFDSLSKSHQPASSGRHGAPTRSFRIAAGLELSSIFVVSMMPVPIVLMSRPL